MGETCYMGVFKLGSMNTLEMKKVLNPSWTSEKDTHYEANKP